jgi:hypothetical protein
MLADHLMCPLALQRRARVHEPGITFFAQMSKHGAICDIELGITHRGGRTRCRLMLRTLTLHDEWRAANAVRKSWARLIDDIVEATPFGPPSQGAS